MIEYYKVIKGQRVDVPELKAEVEAVFPNHKQIILAILSEFGMMDWRVSIQPTDNPDNGKGIIAKGIKLIVLCQCHQEGMMTTLYHEISHYLHPELDEETIEELGKVWYLSRHVVP